MKTPNNLPPVQPLVPDPTPLPVKRNFTPYIITASIALGLTFIVFAVFYFLNSYNQIVVRPNQNQNVTPTVTPTPDPDRPFSILLLGYGGANHDGGRLTDSIIVAQINPKKLSVNLVTVPRDLWVNLPIYENQSYYSKINAAYPIGSDDRNYKNKLIQYTSKAGGGELAKKVISGVVGFPIDYFVSIDFQGFVKAIDLLGGVEVQVERTFDDPQYPIEGKENDLCGFTPEIITAMEATMSGLKLEQAFSCRYEQLHFDKGKVTMDGATALKYVRSRHSPTEGGDYNRSRRQKNLIIAVKNKILSLNFIPKIIPSVKLLTSHLETDIDLTTLDNMLNRFSNIQDYTVSSLALTEDNVLKQGRSSEGQFILMPKLGQDDFSQVHQFIQDPTILTPTVTPKPTKPVN